MIKRIGVIGQGFVGHSVTEGFKNHYHISTFDLDSTKSTEPTLQSLINKSDIVFVCLPTPMKRGGQCDISIIEEVIQEINDYNKNITVLIKSTIPPGTTERFCKQYWNINIIFNPEFLTEANAVNDYINQTRIILGVSEKNCSDVISMFNKVFPKAKVVKTKSKVAEMVKYITNCFLSTKVSFANEMYQICQKLNIDYDKVIEYTKYDSRLGYSHWGVPGPDGEFGYGGHCFPKDMGALKFLANNLGVDTLVLDGIINKNNEVRTNRDWEQQKGRAVSKDYFD